MANDDPVVQMNGLKDTHKHTRTHLEWGHERDDEKSGREKRFHQNFPLFLHARKSVRVRGAVAVSILVLGALRWG